MKIYALMAFRWGIKEGHIYLVGVSDNLKKAEKRARVEVAERDGKYDVVIYECEFHGNKKPICTYRGLGFMDRISGDATE